MNQTGGPIALWATEINGTALLLVNDIMQVDAQALACYASTTLSLQSNIARQLVERGGSSLRAEAAKYSNAEIGDVITLPGGKLTSNYILVAVTNAFPAAPTLATISSCVGGLLQRVSSLGVTGLALPLLRVKRQLGLEDLLRCTLAPVIDHLWGDTSLSQVLIGVQGEDEMTYTLEISHALHKIFDSLLELGKRRAHSQALRETRQQLAPFEQGSGLLNTMLQLELELQLEVQELLKLERARESRSLLGLELELQHCHEGIDDLRWKLAVADGDGERERAVGI